MIRVGEGETYRRQVQHKAFYMCPASNPGRGYYNSPGQYHLAYWGCKTIALAWRVSKNKFLKVGWGLYGCRQPTHAYNRSSRMGACILSRDGSQSDSVKFLNHDEECNRTLAGLTLAQLDACWQTKIIQSFNITVRDPEELDLLGSTNTSGVWFIFELPTVALLNTSRKWWATVDPVSDFPSKSEIAHRVYSLVNCTGKPSKKLPKGTVLICGDRPWNGIPTSPHGGPCYIGKLILFHPNLHQLKKIANHAHTNY